MKLWRRSSRYLAYPLFGAIILVFIAWGFDHSGTNNVGSAAVVDGEVVSVRDFRFMLRRTEEYYSSMFKGALDENMRKQFRIPYMTLNELVDQSLLVQNYKKMGLKVSDQAIRDIFMEDGKFNEASYEGNRQAYNGSAGEFEDFIRRDLARRNMRSLFSASVLPTQKEIEKEKVIRSTKMELEFIKLEKDPAKLASVTQAEQTAFLSKPENLEKIKKYYEEHPSEFSAPDQVQARHILVNAKKGDSGEESKAKAKLKQALEELKTKTFAEVAKKYSDDPGSKDKGGDLGWFGKGRMVPEFEEAAFGLEVGKTSEMIQTNYGFHVIKVEGKRPAKVTTLDEARPEIAMQLLKASKWDEQLADLEKASPDQVLAMAKKVSPAAKWESTGAFSSTESFVPKIGGGDDLLEIVGELTPEKPYAKKLFKSGNDAYVVKLKAITKDDKFNEKTLRDELANSGGQQVFMAWMQDVKKKADESKKIKMNQDLLRGME